ncbi:FKBP-type peptidyl-prolyl cis-trans isomerase, partial [Eubacteriales bacterium DFI.9.88]|nr:FKBP-type peptidyl-prolyl cis-trans isomerase [Eubacteriales bacterium DFI.9.88]
GLTGCGSKPYSKYDLSETVKVGKYKGLEIEKINVSVSDEEVNAQVKANVEQTKTTEKKKEGTGAKGDKVNLDYEGKIDGKTFDGGSSKGYDLTIGSGEFIPGFE